MPRKTKKKTTRSRNPAPRKANRGKLAAKTDTRRRAKDAGFSSYFEMQNFNDLKSRGHTPKYEELTIEWVNVSEHKYRPDFVLPNNIIVELKGKWTNEERKKHLSVIAQHPEIDLRMVFQNAGNRLYAGSNTSYGAWCDKKGIKWVHGSIPDEWLQEEDKPPVPSVIKLKHEINILKLDEED